LDIGICISLYYIHSITYEDEIYKSVIVIFEYVLLSSNDICHLKFIKQKIFKKYDFNNDNTRKTVFQNFLVGLIYVYNDNTWGILLYYRFCI